LTELNPAFCPVSCIGDRLNVTSADCQLPLGGRIYETHAASVNSNHLGSTSAWKATGIIIFLYYIADVIVIICKSVSL